MTNSKMMKPLALTLVSLLPLGYLALVWPTVPETVPTHFDVHFSPDAWSPRSALWGIGLLMAGAAMLTWFLLRHIDKIDPKRADAGRSSLFEKLAPGLVFFLTAINFLCLLAATGYQHWLPYTLLPLLGLLFAFIGNCMHSIRPNYFAGFRLPWTLSSDDNWRRTHQLGSKLWFWGGLVMAAGSLFLKGTGLLAFVFTIIGIMILIPAIYSFWYFRRTKMNGSE